MKYTWSILFCILIIMGFLLWIPSQKDFEQIKNNGHVVKFEVPRTYKRYGDKNVTSTALYQNNARMAGFKITFMDTQVNSPDEYRAYKASPEFYSRCFGEGPQSNTFCDEIITEKVIRDDPLHGYYYQMRLIHEVYDLNGMLTSREERKYETYDVLLPSGIYLEIDPVATMSFSKEDVEYVIRHLIW